MMADQPFEPRTSSYHGIVSLGTPAFIIHFCQASSVCWLVLASFGLHQYCGDPSCIKFSFSYLKKIFKVTTI